MWVSHFYIHFWVKLVNCRSTSKFVLYKFKYQPPLVLDFLYKNYTWKTLYLKHKIYEKNIYGRCIHNNLKIWNSWNAQWMKSLKQHIAIIWNDIFLHTSTALEICIFSSYTEKYFFEYPFRLIPYFF